jgi:hypothetical protein
MISPKRIGVCPPDERPRRARLFRALEEAFPVSFEAREDGQWQSLDAVLGLGDGPTGVRPPSGLRTFHAPVVLDRPHRAGSVCLDMSPLLDARLRGRSLNDGRAGGLVGIAAEGCSVLASCGTEALWTRRGVVDRVTLAPEELEPDQSLRDLLAPGRWLSLLPFVHFLREVVGDCDWRTPMTRASFVIDDANLHWPSYGYVRFAELARTAEESNFHVAIATIPLDAWFVHQGVARLFRDYDRVLSLLIHGNDHTREELARPLSERQAHALLAQALKRAAGLEERSGVGISRVMVAPHGLCSEQMMRELLRTGFQGLCHSWESPRSVDRPLADWQPAEIRAGGLPVFPRLLMTGPRDDLVLRSFLGQPLILYGHHRDLAAGPGVLVEAAAFVNHEVGVVWGSLGDIACSSYMTRRDGTTLRVQVFAREAKLAIPDGAENMIVELPAAHGEAERELVVVTTARGTASARFEHGVSDAFRIPEPGAVTVSLVRSDAVDPSHVASPRPRLRPVIRRAAAESRDRLAPIGTKLGRDARGARRRRPRPSG